MPKTTFADTVGPYYHGGIGGLKPGDAILPPAVTGYVRPQRVLEEVNAEDAFGDLAFKASYDPRFVYFTRTRQMAANHAAGVSNWMKATGAPLPAYGSLYTVQPDSIVIPSNSGMYCSCCIPMRFADGEFADLKAAGWSNNQIVQRVQDENLNEHGPCCFRARRLIVESVVVRQQEAVEGRYWDRLISRTADRHEDWRRVNGAWWEHLN